MPRAFCPECAAEVPIDEEGRCFLGHDVPAAASSSSPRDGVQDATEEPEPWVASVTSQSSQDDDAVDETSAAAGKVGPMDEAVPTTDAGSARSREVTAEGDEVELDLDTLEQAVAEMGLSDEEHEEDEEDAFAVFEEEPSTRGPAPAPAAAEGGPGPASTEPEVEVHEDVVADVLDVQGVSQAEREPEQAEVTGPEPEPAEPEAAAQPEPEPAAAPEPEPAAEPEPEDGAEPDEDEDEEPEPVDTANFLARPKGKRRGLFGR